MNPSLLIKSVVLLLFWVTQSAYPQSVVCEATVEAIRLSPLEQQDLKNLARDIESYINEFEYTDESYNLVFEIKIQIFIESVSVAGSEKLFHAKTAITNNYDQRYFDKRWTFVYTPNEPLYHTGIFHTITSFLDFYVNLLLGGEFDLVEPLTGNRYYNVAREIASRGKNSPHSQGWRNREIRVNDITSNWRLREAKGNYSDFLYLLYDERKPAEALIQLKKFMKLYRDIFEINSLDKYSMEFLNAHLEELNEAIFGYRDESLYNEWVFINPTNEKKYQVYIDRLNSD